MWEWWIYCIILRRCVGGWKRLTLHIASHAWAWLCLWNNPVSTCCPKHLDPVQSGTRFVSHTLSWEEAAQDTAHYDHPWDTRMQEITKWVINIWTIISVTEPINGSFMWRGKHLLTDTRRVSGWPLAVRGDPDVLKAWWLQSCAFNVQKAAWYSEQRLSAQSLRMIIQQPNELLWMKC